MNDLDVIMNFYDHVIDKTENMNKYARWKKNSHPTEEMIRTYIKENAMYLCMEDSETVGAMAVTMSQGEDYHSVRWSAELNDDQVAVIHILCVSPEHQGAGIGKQMIDEAVKLSESAGKKAVRLDALASNTPAHHLYESKSFVYRGKQNLYADNTGWTDFYYFEYEIIGTE